MSASTDATCALFVIWPALWGTTVISTFATSFSSIAPRLQLIVSPERVQLPREGKMVPKLTAPCTRSVKVTLLAVEGPRLVTLTEKVKLLPTATGLREAEKPP